MRAFVNGCANHWMPTEVAMGKDIATWRGNELTEAERRVILCVQFIADRRLERVGNAQRRRKTGARWRIYGEGKQASQRITHMGRHEFGAGYSEETPGRGISLFRERSGKGSLLGPDAERPSDSVFGDTSSFSPQDPLPPGRPRGPKGLLGAALGAGCLFAIVWLCGHSLGGSGYWDHNQRGNTAYSQGDYPVAVAEYSQMVRMRPQKEDGYDLRGMAYYREQQYRLSAQDYRTALGLSASAATTWSNLAYAEDAYGDHHQAVYDFSRSLALNPAIRDRPDSTADAHDGTPNAVKGRMWAYFEDGQYSLALKDCNALIAVHPYPASIAVRGKIYRQMGDFPHAVADFRTALQEDPRLTFVDLHLEEILAQHGQFAAAVSVAADAVKANPADASVEGTLGWCQYQAGQTAQAIQTDIHALTMNPSQPWVRYNLGLTYAVRGDWKDARPAYALAMQNTTQEEWQGGVDDLQKALAQQPQSASVRQSLQMLTAARDAVSHAPHVHPPGLN